MLGVLLSKGEKNSAKPIELKEAVSLIRDIQKEKLLEVNVDEKTLKDLEVNIVVSEVARAI
jgi:hypothetical protein